MKTSSLNNKIRASLFTLLCASSLLLLNPLVARAQSTEGTETEESAFSGITNPVIGQLGQDVEAANTGLIFLEYFIVLWRAIINIGALAVIIFFVWGAIDWITAGGDSGKIQKARDKIVQSIIGLILLVSSFFIIAVLGQIFFGKEFDLLNLTFISPFETPTESQPSSGWGTPREGRNSR